MCFLINTTMFRISATCTDTFETSIADSSSALPATFSSVLIFLIDSSFIPCMICKQVHVSYANYRQLWHSAFDWSNYKVVFDATPPLWPISPVGCKQPPGLIRQPDGDYIFFTTNMADCIMPCTEIMGWIEYEPLFKRASLSVFKTYFS